MWRNLALLALLAASVALGQESAAIPFNAPPPPMIPSAAGVVIGQPGGGTYYYWIVARYVGGNSAPAGPIAVTSAPLIGQLSTLRFIKINWQAAPNATGYDILRTVTNSQPSGSCNCALVTGTTDLEVLDTGAALSAYTVTTGARAYARILLDNVNVPTPRLRQDIDGVISDIGSGSGGTTLTAGPTNALVIADDEIDINTAIVPTLTLANDWLGGQSAATAPYTAPMRLAASPPATCNATIREMYYNTASNAAFVCNSTNVWSPMGASPAARPTYSWSDMCRRASGTGWPGDLGWQNLNGTFTVGAIAGQPPCTVSLEVSGSGDNARMYAGDGGDKIFRLDTDWDFSFDLAATAQNDKTIRIGVNQGTTVGNDSCWIQGDRVDGTTPYTLYCRQGGVDGTATTMTGTTISATRSTFRIRRVGGTVFGSVNGGTEFSVTTRLPTSTFGGSPMIQWINDVGGASGTIFIYNVGVGR